MSPTSVVVLEEQHRSQEQETSSTEKIAPAATTTATASLLRVGSIEVRKKYKEEEEEEEIDNQTKEQQQQQILKKTPASKSHSVTIVTSNGNSDYKQLEPRRRSWFDSILSLKPVNALASTMPSFLPCTKVDSNRRASKQIDKQLNKWNKAQSKVIKLLLIGAGESGKTTIIKQMKILHVRGFTDDERVEKAREIRENVFEAIKELTSNMAYLHPPVELDDPVNQPSLDYIAKLDMTAVGQYDFPQEFYQHVKILWYDKGIQQCYLRSNEFFLIDCAKYFLDKVDEIADTNYQPSDQDILRHRRRTCEIQRIDFQVKVPKHYGGGAQSFWMFDVGGQRGERRKWIQVFDGITAVLFLVDSSGYDCRLREDGSMNRLRESLKLFEDIWNSKYLSNSGIIIFFNKQDILKEKIERGSRLELYFPEFSNYKLQPKDANGIDASEEEYIKARCFIRDMFLEVTKRKRVENRQSALLISGDEGKTRRECFTHFTTATDTGNVKRVFDDVHTMILVSTLNNIV